MTAIPSNWQALLAEHRRRGRETRELLAFLPELIAGTEDPWQRSAFVTGARESLIAMAVVEGPAALRDAVQPLLPFVGPEVEAVGQDVLEEDAPAAHPLLGLLNLLRCCGLATPTTPDGIEIAWLERLTAHLDLFDEFEHHELGLAALAARRPDLAGAFVERPDLGAFVPGLTFGFNVQGFVAYLALGLDSGAAADDVRPAYDEFAVRFPRKLGSQTLTWSALLFAARAFTTHFEGRPVDTVAADLHALVR